RSDCGLFLLSAAVSLAGAATLEQEPRELTVEEGKAVTFQCSMSRYDMMSHYMYWYRQVPRGSLKFIYTDGDIYGEGFQGHFVGSLESSRTTLQI
ncbi:HV741 protein, partial [Thryothorus ludovicianus]|nr:HV741 protein [Thryothorus ludovicianus]